MPAASAEPPGAPLAGRNLVKEPLKIPQTLLLRSQIPEQISLKCKCQEHSQVTLGGGEEAEEGFPAPPLPSLPSLPQALQSARPSFCRAGFLPADSHGLVGSSGAGGARMGRDR